MGQISSELFAQSISDKTAASWAGFEKKIMSKLPQSDNKWFGKVFDFMAGTGVSSGGKAPLIGKHNIKKGFRRFAGTEAGVELVENQRKAAAAVKDAIGRGVDRNSEEFTRLTDQLKAAGKARTAGAQQYLEENAGDIIADTLGKRVAGTAAGAVAGIGGTGYAIHKATEEPEHWYDRFTKSGSLNDIPLYLQDKIASGTGFDPLAMVDKTAGDGGDSVFIGGWKSKDGSRKNPSALGIVSSGLLAGAADALYTQRRAKGRGAVRAALGYLNAPMGALGGSIAGAALAPVTFGLSVPIGAAAGAAGQIAMAGNESPYVHVLPTLGGASIGAVLGAGIGGSVNTSPTRSFNDAGAVIGGLAGAGLGGLSGYALSRLMN